MPHSGPIRWGILSTANIARGAFLPGLRAAGRGVAHVVGSRDLARGRQFAADNGVEHAVGEYREVLEDPAVEAVYIPLPNSLHAEWTIATLRAGKAVLCEKPLCGTVQDTERVLEIARKADPPLWEAFVFPFHGQMARLGQIIAAGDIGLPREVQVSWHFGLSNRKDIRLSAALQGGALRDIGCYAIRLARLVFDAEANSAVAMGGVWTSDDVDEEIHGVLGFSSARRLVLALGMRGPTEVWTRIIGSKGQITMTNAFHPRAIDTMEIRNDSETRTETVASDEPSFAPAIRHIHAVLRGKETPRHLAIDEALGNAEAIDLMLDAASATRRS
jgi:predicted dehydrogenase